MELCMVNEQAELYEGPSNRANNHQLYQCQQCKSKGKWTGIRMIGNEFATDPCTLDHHPEWNPIKTAHNLVDRTVYECLYQYSTVACKEDSKPEWHKQMATIKEKVAQEPEMYQAMVSHHYSRGCFSRRSSIKRVLETYNCGEAGTTMTYIPETFSILPDVSIFVHRLEPMLHVYYNSNTVQMAARNGLHTLVFIHSNLVSSNGKSSCTPRMMCAAMV
ncbi:hypothetical protein ANCCAN_20585 [Ancylostoma caninum]|uniref:Uncharacterized protein n=1 Tax=Ancylostoma caninum TaxID=29170 RepID=A0A368FRX7_ANCCA|nr:hypothetical protein ANCCAN_20585 [Ancylostoma caninum]